jgi:hypothetical protein
MGFRMVDTGAPFGFANPVGFDGVLEGYCPPYFASMDAAVEDVVGRMMRGGGSAPANRPAAHTMADAEFRGGMEEVSDEGIACAKAVCAYIFETYGRFPASVDALHLMWFMQTHHLDLDYYCKYFRSGACGRTHMDHMQRWHTNAEE